MSNLGFWRERARRVIEQVRIAANRQQLTPEQTKQAMDNAYSFGERANSPYEAWLVERNAALVALGLAKPDLVHDLPAERRREEHDQLIANGQQAWF